VIDMRFISHFTSFIKVKTRTISMFF